MKLDNFIVLPFQDYREVAQVLASATVLIAPLDRSAGTFCVPSKILAYLCSGRPTVIAIDRHNPAAAIIEQADAGCVVNPGDAQAFVAAVTRLLDDSELRLHAGRSAREYAERTFAPDFIARKFLNILRSSGAVIDLDGKGWRAATASASSK
jgi:glycosyltransferase involved in cell wall biosynthesis